MQSLNILVRRLWLHLNAHSRMQFVALMILVMFAYFAEILSIGAVVPMSVYFCHISNSYLIS